MKRLVLPWIALLAAPAYAQAADAPFVWKEKARGYESLQQAVDAIGGGTGMIVVAPGSYRQCAVQEAGRIAYVAAQPGTATLEGRACEGKAALVLGGTAARVEGLIFANIRVPDRNGAGIRLEKGDLTVSESLFRDSENGILSADDPAGAIRIERSTFSGLGGCVEDYGCSHGIYVGGYGSLSVRRSRFERGTGGHYVKSRAPRIEITDSSFDDTGGRATNYMIDLSNGATGLIARNVFVQGRDKENYSAFVMVAPEGAENDSAGLALVDNEASLAPGVSRSTAFVADESGAAIRIENNRLGTGITRFEKR
ncbi:right-handed parallel beta-helix repeat-containing protein [Sphingosinicella sp. LY1275]|uniref:right-handed parallel beta-helix repeat-containing protein n=1 Tax=Sphingosinicella sp. LY1275 TaxID=3095379 RepID=UPI002ADEA93D|nr:right-handed parallel beta-helix repeat-containing protein [Sphingosinicella sp. LY1275]MEA1014380.1 right-handed parallel beta-helix repeat-containing protein [Sphingosinicella sp. LY1275]